MGQGRSKGKGSSTSYQLPAGKTAGASAGPQTPRARPAGPSNCSDTRATEKLRFR